MRVFIPFPSPPPTGVGAEAWANSPTLRSSQPLSTKKTCCKEAGTGRLRGETPEGEASATAPSPGRACVSWTLGSLLRSWRPTSTSVGRSSRSPPCTTSFLDTPKGRHRALRRRLGTPENCLAWVTWPGPHQSSFHPSYAHSEFATESSAQAAVGLNKSIFQRQVIKVCEPHESSGHLEVRGAGMHGLTLSFSTVSH